MENKKIKNSLACKRYYANNRETILLNKKECHPNRNIWKGMLQRCYNINREDYKYYGALGIEVCDFWHSFENFNKDMGTRPSMNHTIDRIDGKLNYCKENCRWATRMEQAQNLKSNRVIKYKGEDYNLASLGRKLEMPISTLHKKLKKGEI